MYRMIKDYIKIKNILILAGGIILVAIILSGIYFYHEIKILSGKVSLLTNELGGVRTTILSASSSEASTISSLRSQTAQALKEANLSKPQEDLLTEAVAKATPGVVSIVESEDVPQLQITYENPFGDDPDYQNFGFQIPVYKQVGESLQKVSAGTGFFISSDGYIVTNKHVVPDTNAIYTVLLSNGSQKTATVVYRDPNYDIAVVKVDGTGYSTVPL